MFPKEKSYDVVIVGGGLSGLAAAISAREKNLTTLVLEKGRTIGGNGNYVEGAMGVDSYLQKKQNVKINKLALLHEELNYSHYEASARHLKKFIDYSGQTIDWLHSLGVKFNAVSKQGDSWSTIHPFTGGGHAAVQTMYNTAVKADAEFISSTSAQKVLIQNGQICGLIIRNEATGQERHLTTNNIILATGGYVDNPELVRKKSPFSDRLLTVSNGKATGDGLQLAWAVGAKHYQMGAIQYGGGAIYDTVKPPFIHMSSQLATAATQEAILWVNERGERFVNEDVNDNMCHAGASILTQSRVFSIFDQEAIEHLSKIGLYKEVGNSPVSPETLDRLPSEIKTNLENHEKYLTTAASLTELAEKLQLPKLSETIAHYNQLVQTKQDSDFGKNKAYLTPVKDGPFYAVELGVGMACALGGLRVDNNNNILNSYGYPIPGLYAVGNDAAGMLVGDTYAVTLPGSTAGYAAYSGRNAVLNIIVNN
ncbi:MAG TPA: FAD-dependent oxidoreductase [Candidatus Ligilactobacillus excrementavium]|nr:FAD-dependent oxidoreductase [Candidatus Ligilactobacillus excrementavium]